MPNPVLPAGFKPVIQGYGIGAPDGVDMTEIGGGLPRIGLAWDRGRLPFQVTLILQPDAFSVWTVWYLRVIKKGALMFEMPLDSGFGLQQHLCVMVPGSYNAQRAQGSHIWSVTFAVLAEPPAYAVSDADAQTMVDLWNATQSDEDTAGLGDLLRLIDEVATQDTTEVLG